jgi:hypothetical protein
VGDRIDIQDYMKLDVESVNGEKRLFEESGVDDEYVDSLESGEYEYDWLTEWNKYWKWDENKKEYIGSKGRISDAFVHHTIQQINEAKKRKDKERNLKIKQLTAIYPDFDLKKFDKEGDYETEWINKYNKERVKNN